MLAIGEKFKAVKRVGWTTLRDRSHFEYTFVEGEVIAIENDSVHLKSLMGNVHIISVDDFNTANKFK